MNNQDWQNVEKISPAAKFFAIIQIARPEAPAARATGLFLKKRLMKVVCLEGVATFKLAPHATSPVSQVSKPNVP